MTIHNCSCAHAGADAGGIGVNYGTRGTTLPPPADVARFLARDTLVDRVRLLDADPAVLQAQVLRAFADKLTRIDTLNVTPDLTAALGGLLRSPAAAPRRSDAPAP